MLAGTGEGGGILARAAQDARERAAAPAQLLTGEAESIGTSVRAGGFCISKDAPTLSAELCRSGTSPSLHSVPSRMLHRAPSASRTAEMDARLCAISKEAVTNINVDPPDLTPILDAITRLEAKVSANIHVEGVDLSPILSRIERIEAHQRNFTVDAPDLNPVLTAIEQLDHHGKHSQVLEAIGGLQTEPDLTHVTRAVENVHGRHVELLEAVNQLGARQQVVDLDPLHAAIERIGSQQQVVDLDPLHAAIARVGAQQQVVDLDPLHAAIERIGERQQVVDLDPLHAAIERLDVHGRHQEVLDAITNVVVDPVDLTPLERRLDQLARGLEDVFQEVRRSSDELRSDMAALRLGLQDQRQEIRVEPDHDEIAARLHARMAQHDFGHGQVLEAIGGIPRTEVDFGPLHQQIQSLHEAVRGIEMPAYDHSEVLSAIGRGHDHHSQVLDALDKIVIDIDYNEIAARVHDRVRGHDFGHSEVLDAITNIQVEPTDMTPVVDAIRASERMMMDEIRSITFDIDYAALAEAVHGRVSSHDFGHSEVLRAINEIRIEGPDHDAIADRVHAKVKEHDFGHEEVLRAVSNIRYDGPNHDEIADRLHAKVMSHDFGHGEVLKAISSIEQPDHDAIAAKLHSKVMEHDFGHGEVLRAVQGIDLNPLHDAIRGIDIPTYDDTELLKAVKSTEVDVDGMAEAVHNRMRGHDFGHGEVLHAITNIKIDEPDLTPILEAIRRLEVDLQPVMDALAKINAKIDFSEVLRAISRIRLDVDYDHIGDIVAERAPRPDNKEVLQAIKKIKLDPPDYAEIAELFRSRVEPRQSEILAAVNKIRIPDVDLSPVLASIGTVKAEFGPVLDAIRGIRIPKLSAAEVADEVVAAIQSILPQIDVGAIAEAVFAKFRGVDFGHSKVLTALKSLEPMDIDYAEISAAVSRVIPRHDNSEVLRALNNLNFRVDMTEVMQGVVNVKQLLDQIRLDIQRRPPPQVVVQEQEVVREKIVHPPQNITYTMEPMPVTTSLVPQVATLVEPRVTRVSSPRSIPAQAVEVLPQVAPVVEPLTYGQATTPPTTFPIREPTMRGW